MDDRTKDILRYMRQHDAKLAYSPVQDKFNFVFPNKKKRPKPAFGTPLGVMECRHMIGGGYVENVGTKHALLALTDKGHAHARTFPLKPTKRGK